MEDKANPTAEDTAEDRAENIVEDTAEDTVEAMVSAFSAVRTEAKYLFIRTGYRLGNTSKALE